MPDSLPFSGRTPVLTAEDQDRLRHMLGATPSRVHMGLVGHRNYYACELEGQSIASLRRLQGWGLVFQGRQDASLVSFHATEAGCHAAGLSPAQTQRALQRAHAMSSPYGAFTEPVSVNA